MHMDPKRALGMPEWSSTRPEVGSEARGQKSEVSGEAAGVRRRRVLVRCESIVSEGGGWWRCGEFCILTLLRTCQSC
jgi:hypothetical protein